MPQGHMEGHRDAQTVRGIIEEVKNKALLSDENPQVQKSGGGKEMGEPRHNQQAGRRWWCTVG